MAESGAQMLTYKHGDVLESGADVIAHQVNCFGVMGAGLARQIREKYPHVYEEYHKLCERNNHHIGMLGVAHWSKIDDSHWIANLFGQHGYGRGEVYTVMPALKVALMRTVQGCEEWADAEQRKIRLALPYKLGCGLAGGNWEEIRRMIEEIAKNTDVEIEIWRIA